MKDLYDLFTKPHPAPRVKRGTRERKLEKLPNIRAYLECPECGREDSESYSQCPGCGTRVRAKELTDSYGNM